MTKIYEALEQAGKEREEVKKGVTPQEQHEADVKTQISAKTSEARSQVKKDFKTSIKTDSKMEEIMIGLYQNIASQFTDIKGRSIEFISAREGEGTSILLREFAKAVALKVGKKVLLLDADPKQYNQSQYFIDRPLDYGWSVEKDEDDDAVKYLYQYEDTPLFISQISLETTFASILDSPKFDENMKKLKEKFDLVLFDSPAVNMSPDGLALSRKVDGVILVIESEKTRWQVAADAKNRILEHGGKILGAVINNQKHYIPQFIYDKL